MLSTMEATETPSTPRHPQSSPIDPARDVEKAPLRLTALSYLSQPASRRGGHPYQAKPALGFSPANVSREAVALLFTNCSDRIFKTSPANRCS